MHQHVAVIVEHFRFGDKAQILAAFVHYRQVPGIGLVERMHHFLHAAGVEQSGWSGGHQLVHGEAVIQLLAEDDVADVVQRNDAEQVAILVCHWKYVAVGA